MNAIKKLIVLVFVLPLFWACNGDGNESNPVLDSLNNVNNGLNTKVGQQDSTIQAFLRSFNEIQENLDMIKEKEKLINSSKLEGDVKSKEQQIVDDIQAIYDLMNKNKNKLAAMSTKLKKANGKITELEKMLARLQTQIEEKDGEIADLKAQLEKLNVELANLQTNYEEAQQESDAKTELLNTAYYAFGTKKELIKQGVLTKDGGFIGIGKTTKLSDNFNKEYFTKVDIRTSTEIPLACKKAKFITTHPSSSYKFEGEEGKKIEKLIINEPNDFWSASKYLVIVIE